MSSNSAKSNVGARLASPDKVSVVLTGHQGRVGEVLAAALKTAPEIDYLGGIGVEDDLPHLLRQWGPQVVVDFTRPATARSIAMAAVASGAAPVVGTSGMSESTVDELESACQQAGIGGIVAPNFAIGAVAMMWLAERVASLFTSAEVIEMHHTGKADAPSGTALA
ncbi:MAG: dihydrodipicolinate reductase C-terminal domain-containing protein, partial [Candidatus Dormibacteraceae bacterium]